MSANDLDKPTRAARGNDRAERRRLLLVIVGLVVVLLSPVPWALMLDNNLLQRTALPMWLAMASGAGLAVWAARLDRRKRTRVVAVATVVWVLLSIPGYVVFTRLPAETSDVALASVLDATRRDHVGQSRTLRGMLRKNIVLLVFYRGHW